MRHRVIGSALVRQCPIAAPEHVVRQNSVEGLQSGAHLHGNESVVHHDLLRQARKAHRATFE